MAKVSNEVANAALVQSLLAGGSIDSAIEDAAMVQSLLAGGIPETTNCDEEDNEEEIDIDMSELDGTKKKKSKAKSSKKEETTVVKQELLEECTFANIEKYVTFNVKYGDHDIHYKEQRWPIPEREVEYRLERIDIPKEAENAVYEIHKDNVTEELKDKARSGEIRLLKAVSYENIPYAGKYIGYVEIKPDKKVRTSLNKEAIKKVHADVDKVMASIKGATKQMVKYL